MNGKVLICIDAETAEGEYFPLDGRMAHIGKLEIAMLLTFLLGITFLVAIIDYTVQLSEKRKLEMSLLDLMSDGQSLFSNNKKHRDFPHTNSFNNSSIHQLAGGLVKKNHQGQSELITNG